MEGTLALELGLALDICFVLKELETLNSWQLVGGVVVRLGFGGMMWTSHIPLLGFDGIEMHVFELETLSMRSYSILEQAPMPSSIGYTS